jgi:phenylpyruvate tautomerase PptA (4-oxalocrotonate tautomerase family)
MPEVYVHVARKRSLEQKRALVKGITEVVVLRTRRGGGG